MTNGALWGVVCIWGPGLGGVVMRAFLCIRVPQPLWPAVERLQGALGCGRAVAGENLHLTLVFLGDLGLPELEAVHEALEGLRLAPFVLEPAGLEVLGGAERPEALALGLRPSPALEALQAKCMQAVRRAGVALERRRFRPHVTIARFGARFDAGQAQRLGRLLQAHGDVVLPEWRVGRLALMRSHLGHEGASYEVLAEYPQDYPGDLPGAGAWQNPA